MSATLHFSRTICPAVEPIGFESQIDVFMSNGTIPADPPMTYERITIANVGIVEGMLTADFHLNDGMFNDPEEISISRIIADPPSDAAPSTAIQITGIVLERRWPSGIR